MLKKIDFTGATVEQLENALAAAKLKKAKRDAEIAEKTALLKSVLDAEVFINVMDLLNQAMIIMKDVSAGDEKKINLIKFAVSKLVEADESHARELYSQYYNSNCY